MSEFMIIGKVLYAELDAEGNLHVMLKNSNRFWAEAATKHLRQLNGQIIETKIKKWTPNNTTKKATA